MGKGVGKPFFSRDAWGFDRKERGAMGLSKCGMCGVPRQVILTNRWREDGIIETKPVGTREVVFLERELVVEVFQGIQDKLGIPIDRIVMEAKRKDALLYADGVLTGVLGILRWKPLRRSAYRFLINQSAAIGLGHIELLDYRPGSRLFGRADPVYHRALFTGDVAGGFESIERKRAGVITREEDGWFILELRTTEEAGEEDRLIPVESKAVKTKAEYERCGSCGVPREISRFRWVKEKGQIIDTATGEWVFVIGRGGIGAVIRELREELGEEIPRLVAEHTRRFYRRLMEKQRGEAFNDLSFMGPRGMGVPVPVNIADADPALGVSVFNPFNPPMVAGMVAAVSGAGQDAFDWEEEREGVMAVRMS